MRLTSLLVTYTLIAGPARAAAPEEERYDYSLSAFQGDCYVGRGPVRALVSPWRIVGKRGLDGEIRLILNQGGRDINAGNLSWRATVFPGGVRYTHAQGADGIEVTFAGSDSHPFAGAVRLTGAYARAELRFSGTPATWRQKPIGDTLCFALDRDPVAAEELTRESRRFYLTGLTLDCPDNNLSRAVIHSRALLDLADNGRLHACDIFRFPDIWSRDLGSGFGPGLVVAGDLEGAKRDLLIDLARHEKATAAHLKTTSDASKGGSVEGLAWLSDLLRRHYLATGDKTFAKRVLEGLKPWVEAWLDRDPDHTGLVVDVTDWMDHSRHLLLPLGARTLYANVLYARLLENTAYFEDELGDPAAAARLRDHAARTAAAIHHELWSDSLGAFANASFGARVDLRVDSGANALAAWFDLLPPPAAATTMATVRRRCARPHGSLTITPPMSHVGPDVDQNERLWPWWMAWEAKAHLKYGDPAYGLKLLQDCARTAAMPTLPGLMEEILDKDGRSEGGHAFTTAGGSLITAVHDALFGISITRPGCAAIAVDPRVPADWTDCRLHVPTAGGGFTVARQAGHWTVTVRDARIRSVAVPGGFTVIGAAPAPLPPPAARRTPALPAPKPLPAPRKRTPCRIAGIGATAQDSPLGALPEIRIHDFPTGARAADTLIVITGNALPYRPPGLPAGLPETLKRFIDAGGALLIDEAAMNPARGSGPAAMGGEGGLFEWRDGAEPQARPLDPPHFKPVRNARRAGTTYWGEGPYFSGLEIEWGVFGMKQSGTGVDWRDRIHPGDPRPRPEAIFTDFAVRAPWRFRTLATTTTTLGYAHPARDESFACVVRLHHDRTGADIFVAAKGALTPASGESLLRAATGR